MICIATLSFTLLASLGFWQLHRANEKKNMLLAEHLQRKQKPLLWDSNKTLPQQYQLLQVEGVYLPYIFLLDNQYHRHQWGFDVLSPMLLAGGQVVLIDRGWVLGDSTRQSFPKIITPMERLPIQGQVYYPSSKQWVLGPAVEKKNDKLSILEKIDTQIAEQILQKKVYPFIIRLDRKENYGFLRDWAIVSMAPERHLAYAWQWFSMALAVFILFIVLNVKRNEKTNN